jgi:hypothetical protein
MWSESKKRCLQSRFQQFPGFCPFELKSEVFLEVSVPIRIVSSSADKCLNLSLLVKTFDIICRWEVAGKVLPQLHIKMLHVQGIKLETRCKVQRRLSLSICFKCLLWAVCRNTVNAGFFGVLGWLIPHMDFFA